MDDQEQKKPEPKNFSVMVKLIGAAILAIVVVIVVLQNTEPVQTRLLFAEVTMPRAVLLFLTTAIGFVLGMLVALITIRRRSKRRKAK